MSKQVKTSFWSAGAGSSFIKPLSFASSVATEWNPTWANMFVPLDRKSQLDNLSPPLKSEASFRPHCLQISNVFGEMSTHAPEGGDSALISPSAWMDTDPPTFAPGASRFSVKLQRLSAFITYLGILPTNDLKHYSNAVQHMGSGISSWT